MDVSFGLLGLLPNPHTAIVDLVSYHPSVLHHYRERGRERKRFQVYVMLFSFSFSDFFDKWIIFLLFQNFLVSSFLLFLLLLLFFFVISTCLFQIF